MDCFLEQQGACYLGQSPETGQDLNVPQQALEAKPHTILNTLVQESEERTGKWELESAWIQLQLTNCRDELRHKEAETAIFKGQLVEKDEQIKTLLKLNSTMQQQLVSLKAELKEKTKETTIDQETDNLGQQLLLKEEQEPITSKPPHDEEEQKEVEERQLICVEEKLKNCQVEISRLLEQLREKEQQKDNLRVQFIEMEQQLKVELKKKRN